jgi:hypothetical protein
MRLKNVTTSSTTILKFMVIAINWLLFTNEKSRIVLVSKQNILDVLPYCN